MGLFHLFKPRYEEILQAFGILQQAFFLNCLNGSQGGGAGHGVAAVTGRSAYFFNRLGVGFPHHHGGYRESVAEALADGYHVRQCIPVFYRKEFSGPSHGSQDLVREEQDFMLIAPFPEFREEIVRRKNRTGPALDRFKHNRGHLSGCCVGDKLIIKPQISIGINHPVRLFKERAIGIGARHHVKAGRTGRAI